MNTTTTTKPEMLLWLSDARGRYIPRDFANSFKDRAKHVSGVTAEDWAILETGPDHEHYWDAWSEVCDSAIITDEGTTYRVHQDGDLLRTAAGTRLLSHALIAWDSSLACA